MHDTAAIMDGRRASAPLYAGLRMSADDYLSLPDDGYWYELLDGVVVWSPSPTPRHQHVVAEIVYQLQAFLRHDPIGAVYPETDVRFDAKRVYRPELVFIRAERVRANWGRITEPPDLVVEVVSPESRRYDHETKKSDYERFGVAEYWIIDPEQDAMTFHRLRDGRFETASPRGDRFESTAVPGFALDIPAVRRSFSPL